MTQVEPLAENAILEGLSQFTGWEYAHQKVSKTFTFEGYLECVNFVNVVASIAERQAHHPDIALHYGKVTLSYSTHDAGHQVSAKDLKAVGAVEAYLAL